MKVKCIRVTSQNQKINNTSFETLLKLNQIYSVYGIHFSDPITYEVFPDSDDFWTIEVPYYFFDLVDNRLSKYFCLGYSPNIDHRNNENAKMVPFISFPEWVSDPHFFEQLIEDDPRAIEIMKRYKLLIETEFDESAKRRF